jgi:tRNA nucleotidyltransferase/poly(A) polymerase
MNSAGKSIKNEEIKSALYKKVSNERIHKELELMFEGNKPQCAIYILYKFDILDNILKLPLSDQINGIIQ